MEDKYVHPYETTKEVNSMDSGGYAIKKTVKVVHRGITLRDQFAMHVLTGLAKGYRSATGCDSDNMKKVMALDCKIAYALADAMLKAGNESPPLAETETAELVRCSECGRDYWGRKDK